MNYYRGSYTCIIVCLRVVPGGVRTHLEDSVMDSLLTVDDYLSVMLKCCFRYVLALI